MSVAIYVAYFDEQRGGLLRFWDRIGGDALMNASAKMQPDAKICSPPPIPYVATKLLYVVI